MTRVKTTISDISVFKCYDQLKTKIVRLGRDVWFSGKVYAMLLGCIIL